MGDGVGEGVADGSGVAVGVGVWLGVGLAVAVGTGWRVEVTPISVPGAGAVGDAASGSELRQATERATLNTSVAQIHLALVISNMSSIVARVEGGDKSARAP